MKRHWLVSGLDQSMGTRQVFAVSAVAAARAWARDIARDRPRLALDGRRLEARVVPLTDERGIGIEDEPGEVVALRPAVIWRAVRA